MTKVRVYELAKELNLSSKELMEKIEGLDLKINSHMSSIEDEEALLIKELLTEDNKAPDEPIKEIEEEIEAIEILDDEKPVKKKGKKDNKDNRKKFQSQVEVETHPIDPVSKEIKIIEIEPEIIVKDLAEKLGVNPSKVITKLIGLGVMVNQNQAVDGEIAALVADEFGFQKSGSRP